tara:strand:+ start:253 stop:1233 length:981 start_codon:yes stop_codon:yes gene_type:complete
MIAVALTISFSKQPLTKQMKNPRSYDKSEKAAQFTAAMRPFVNQNGMRWAGKCEVFRTDTMETLATCSPNYQIVQHSEVLERAETALKGLGLKDWNREVIVFDNGGEMRAKYRLHNGKTKKDVAVGDALGFTLELDNGLNGRSTLLAKGGIEALVCSNGMTSVRDATTGFNRKHNGLLSLDAFKKSITELLNVYSKDVLELQRLTKMEFNHADGLNMIDHLIAEVLKTTKNDSIELVGLYNDPDSGLHPEYRGQKIHGEAGGQRNAWHVYSACTAFLRNVENDRGAFDIVRTKRKALAGVFGGIASGKRELKPLLVPRADSVLDTI